MIYDLVVIGGGPAGLFAAGNASMQGFKVLLLERMNHPGRKLRITGKGRCNLTNITPIPEFIKHFEKNGKFLRQSFSQFFTQELIDFFQNLGVETAAERGNRVFPASGSAVEVTDALVRWAINVGVEIHTNCRVKDVRKNHDGLFEVHCDKDNQEISITRNLIIASGGKSYPLTGSSGDGYAIAERFGHTVIKPLPALVPLETDQKWISSVEGLKLKNVRATLYIDNKKSMSDFGEMEFRDATVCGPIILSMSGSAVESLVSLPFVTHPRTPLLGREGRLNGIKGELVPSVFFSIDLKPALEHDQLDARLLREISSAPNSKLDTILHTLLPAKLIPVCCEMTRIDSSKPCNQITSEERKQLRLWLKDFRIPITGHRDWNEAIITRGGVDLKEINPKTMESKLTPNLYFAGEILDLDADTGGYNLQAAFSTAYSAALHIR
ncbi:MAG TPA: NAD(P)/FAD-dependent oxidoreductase [Candidatus Cloacimonadota bacterium]|nr:NAD(P)/FAD-dependent oxidoreductase [Candidatus Cloacimonadota bacterium]HPT70994.1 NAD(P)/FAD-dependent oxidoreductase [Candidatus Cloacimonadota bacterium]